MLRLHLRIAAAALPLLLASAAPAPAPPRADRPLQYVSDFLCFVGEDAAGRALLAFDVNRGRDGERLQSEHFARLHVEGEGWVRLRGLGDLPKARATFEALPSSADWTLSGDAQEGVRVESERNGLVLATEPLAIATTRGSEGNRFDTGSAPATLTWKDRTFEGVVLYEYCFLASRNPLTNTYTDLFGDGYHSVYATVAGADGPRALRLHRSGGWLEPLVGARTGFLGAPDGPTWIRDFTLEVSRWSLGGFFRWPGKYVAVWPEHRLDVLLKAHETVANFVLGGVAVKVVDGTLTDAAGTHAVYGLSLVVR